MLMSLQMSSIQELIAAMHKYPKYTVFHFNSWTFGLIPCLPTNSIRYEDLWVAVAAAFKCKVLSFITSSLLKSAKIHVDRYRYELYGSIKSTEAWVWGPFLRGHPDKGRNPDSATRFHQGVLTEDPNTPFHSCESKGVCAVRDAANVVQIIPITTQRPVRCNEETWSNSFRFHNDPVEEIRANPFRGRLHAESPPERSVKRATQRIIREPGHTLLEPQENWQVHEAPGGRGRPTIISDDGVALPYYLVLALFTSPNFTVRAARAPFILERTEKFRKPPQTVGHLPLCGT